MKAIFSVLSVLTSSCLFATTYYVGAGRPDDTNDTALVMNGVYNYFGKVD
jgi:hypothetical protein